MLIELGVGRGGWLRWQTIDPDMYGLFRVEGAEGERLEVVEMHMAQAPRRARDLGRIPLAEVNAALADPEFESMVRAHLGLPGPLLTVAASWWSTSLGRNPGHWAGDMLLSQLPGSGVPPAPIAWSDSPLWGGIQRARAERQAEPDVTLEVPDKRPYGDDFYRSVAEVYSSIAWRSQRPAAAIADANAVPVTTVHRWIRQARERGFLRQAEQGRRG